MQKKLFTPQEANKRLPLIKQIVQDILDKGGRLKALALMEPTPSVAAEQKQLAEEIEKLMKELEGLGCYFKDWNFEVGLVDFPAIVNDQEVLLCWRTDEPIVRWYHGYDDGYVGRKLIPENLI